MATAALACAWISLPAVALPPVAAGIVFAWVWHLAQSLQRAASAVREIEIDATGSTRWRDRAGQWHDAKVLPGSYVSAWLVVVILGTSAGGRRALVLPPDAASGDDLRRLRAWLRWRLVRQ